MALLKFLKGNYSNLTNTAIAEGQVLICGDTGEMFVDVAADKRVKIGDFVVMSDLASLEALDASAVPTSRLYYVEDGNILARSNGTSWIQINKQKTLAELGGVSKTVYDEKMTALAKADTDNATAISNLTTYVGTIPEGATATNVVAYIDEKTAGIASDTALTNLAEKVATAESDIDNLQAAIGENGSVTNAIAAAKAAGDAAQEDVDALAGKVGEVAEGKTVVGMIGDVDTKAGQGITDAATAQARADEAYDLADGKATMDQVNAAISGAGHAVKSEVDAAIEQLGKDYVAADTALETKLQGNIDKKVDQTAYDTKMTELAGADTTLQGNIDALSDKVGTPTEGKTVAQMATDAQTAADTEKARAEGKEAELAASIKTISDDYLKAKDKEELQGNIDTLTGVVETLRDGVDAEKVDGVIDLINYVEEHGTEVTGMKEDIAQNAEAIAGVAGRMTTAEGKITAVEGAVATKAEQTALDEAIEALEGADTSLGNRITALENQFTGDDSVDAKIATAKQEAIKAAAADAANKDAVVLAETQQGIAAVQGDVDAVAGRVTTAEGKITALEAASATHALKTEVQAVQTALDEYETVNNAAVALKADASAVSAMDEAYKAADTALSGRIKDLEDNKAGYATTGQVATAKSEAISEAATTAQTKVDALANGQVKANTEAIAANAAAITSGDEATLTSAKAYCENLMSWGNF